MRRDLPIILGIASVLLAILPFFPKILFVIGALIGFWGIFLMTTDRKRYRQDIGMLRIAQGLCFIGTATCIFVLIYFA